MTSRGRSNRIKALGCLAVVGSAGLTSIALSSTPEAAKAGSAPVDLTLMKILSPPSLIGSGGRFDSLVVISGQSAKAVDTTELSAALMPVVAGGKPVEIEAGPSAPSDGGPAKSAYFVAFRSPGQTSLELGTYRLKVCVDPKNEVAETNETNNCKVASGRTRVTNSIPVAPDLW